MRILVLGATGMLGSAVYRFFGLSEGVDVVGVVRSAAGARALGAPGRARTLVEADVLNSDRLAGILADLRPDAVINCIGVVKQLADVNDPLITIPINSLLPHRLHRLCRLADARLVHVSTDCVFAGTRGTYLESDTPDAYDLYGRSKLLGEIDGEGAITLRTSIIGHEIGSANGLVGWFLAQEHQVNGYTRAIFSGLPTVELARVIRDHVLPRPHLHGLYHVSAAPIAKYDLLKLVAATYGKKITINPLDEPRIDRSLNSDRFQREAEYTPSDWPVLVERMHAFG